MKAYLEAAEIERMEEQAGNLRDKLLIQLLFHLGCRVSEALSLRVGDVDFNEGKVSIIHLKTRTHLACPSCGVRLARRHKYCPGCGTEVTTSVKNQSQVRRRRVLPLDAETLSLLKSFLGQNATTDSELTQSIFAINRHRAWQIVKKCAEKAGFSRLINPETGRVHNVSPHRLRDAFSVHAMKLDDSGDALRLLQEHLGHSSFNTTAKYRKIAGEEHRKWYDKLWQDTAQ